LKDKKDLLSSNLRFSTEKFLKILEIRSILFQKFSKAEIAVGVFKTLQRLDNQHFIIIFFLIDLDTWRNVLILT
jgi:hypothetical protein